MLFGIFSTLNLKNFTKHIRFLQHREISILDILLKDARLKNGGHDLGTPVFYSNGSLAYSMHRCIETARHAKEGLHARGIILIDGCTYDEYTRLDASGNTVRARTPYTQKIEFTKSFLSLIHDSIKNKKIDKMAERQFYYCDSYIVKRERFRIMARLNTLKHKAGTGYEMLIKTGINLCNSCESVPEKLVSPLTNFVGSFMNTRNSNSSSYENKNPEYSDDYRTPIKENFKINSLLTSIASYAHKTVKQWTKSVDDICHKMIVSGMTPTEVGRVMIKQGYVNTIDEFSAKYSPPQLC